MATAMHDVNSLNHKPDAVMTPGFSLFKRDSELSFVRAYDPKQSAVEGMTQHVIRYRDTKGTATKTAQMVFLPQIELPAAIVLTTPDAEPTINENGYLLPEKARKVLIGAIEDAQSDLIRAQLEEKKSVIEWSSVTLESALDYLTAVRTSFRLTKEAVEAWANIALQKACNARADEISAEKGYPIDSEKFITQREGTLKRYVSETGKLSAAVPNLGQEAAIAVQNMLEKAGNDDDIAKTLKKKLHVILNPKFTADDL